MQYNNIIFISGDNSFLIEREKNRLITAFGEKYGQENIVIYSLDFPEKYGEYINEIASVSMFAEKRMFVFFGGNEKKPKKNDTQRFDFYLEKILPQLSPNDVLLFHSIQPNETTLLNFLKKYASIREQKFSWNIDTWSRYSDTSEKNIKIILELYQKWEKYREKWNHNPLLSHDIYNTIQVIGALEKENFKITEEIIWEFSQPYSGAKIFDFIDNILACNHSWAFFYFDKIRQTLDSKNIDIFFASLISNIRNNLYIIYLRDCGFSQAEIAKNLSKVHPFVLSKAYGAKISAKLLSEIFRMLVEANFAYKSGKWIWENELWRIFIIDTVIFSLKKLKK